ncbi:hypothetical protein O7608_09040 [Solwaraspora sp. WMMA2056]|uniref:hypothetical protein n=1 Tax=Solwaraspora sp. WMMA2056 TaxID=3015161 RepID=UPI00259AF3CE|nr:hypothetical protein [Solwaraspora sp. WMMA2056]WJK42500.1 hypothetical protein O7608_09040 [Solwaraspora sp. WMMA2056]
MIEDLGEQQRRDRTVLAGNSGWSRIGGLLRWPPPHPWPARVGWRVAAVGTGFAVLGTAGAFLGNVGSIVGFGVALIGGALLAVAVAYRVRRSWPGLLVTLAVALVSMVVADLASIGYLSVAGDRVTAVVAARECAQQRGDVVDCDYQWQDASGAILVSDLLSDDRYQVGDSAELVVDPAGLVSVRPADTMSPDLVSLLVAVLGGPLLVLLVVRCLAVGEGWLPRRGATATTDPASGAGPGPAAGETPGGTPAPAGG